MRREAFQNFEKLGFPTKRNEEWKYTNLKPILKGDYKLFPKTEEDIEFKDVKKYFLNEIDSYKVVFINGVYSSWLSETTHRGYDICTFGNALNKYPDAIEGYFNKIAKGENQAMVSLNTAFAKEGAFIRVPKNTAVDKPIQIIFFNTTNDREMMVQPRNLVILEEGAKAEIIERHQSLVELPILTNVVTEVSVGANAQLQYYKLQNDHHAASLIDNTWVNQHRDSIARFSTFSFGGRLTRNNLHFALKESGSFAYMNGVTIIEEGQHVDHHTLADHLVPHCESHELYKGIYGGNAHGVFNGKIVVHKDAQKTNAFQQNDNILVSDRANVDTKPQLEIYADDVKCSHGCTIGQLDEEALFYLKSRGIGDKEAKALLMYAFASDALSEVGIRQLKEKVNMLIAKKLGVNLDFEL
ncbi:Fe-S cluster assembly protein SufD [Phaeocystidibacter marisrubri]|uniref:Fe-S cluster assembly protein SufD n=2 Tax=Phaeocystidibacter marisrubri TaxID=1577780 RepID=A0A6L3ZFK3_9FLAO|nr:Fe-S cluster assembly protein SufD [Phaeocystidibacter marisrubri]